MSDPNNHSALGNPPTDKREEDLAYWNKSSSIGLRILGEYLSSGAFGPNTLSNAKLIKI